MDPTKTLERILELTDAIKDRRKGSGRGRDQDLYDYLAWWCMVQELAEKIKELDEWIQKGGFLPYPWNDPTRALGPCKNVVFEEDLKEP